MKSPSLILLSLFMALSAVADTPKLLNDLTLSVVTHKTVGTVEPYGQQAINVATLGDKDVLDINVDGENQQWQHVADLTLSSIGDKTSFIYQPDKESPGVIACSFKVAKDPMTKLVHVLLPALGLPRVNSNEEDIEVICSLRNK